jgi:hypothetical protein
MLKLALPILAALTLAPVCQQAFCQAADTGAPHAYTRVANPDTNTVQLQIALRKFVPAQNSGPAIWLAGVMHVGESSYYQALQRFLDAQTLVLYEGIDPDAHPRHVHDSNAPSTNHPARAIAKAATNDEYSIQTALAHSLGLVFQLEAIDYDRTNFLNSDLSVEQIQRIMAGGMTAAEPGAGPNVTLEVLLQIMDGSSFLGSLVRVGLHFVADNPQLQAAVKLALIEAVGGLKGDLSEVQGLPPDWKKLVKVLIQARNENVVNDLAAELKKIPASGSIAVFYGAGHMDDMEKRIVSDLHYHAADEMWLPAFSVDLHKSGLTSEQVVWMRNLIRTQMDQMQKP